jgi:hypothetical protein
MQVLLVEEAAAATDLAANLRKDMPVVRRVRTVLM